MSIFKAIGSFVSKEVTGAEKTIAAIGAFLKKEEPAVEKVLSTAIADYKILQTLATSPEVEAALAGLARFIADLMAL
jgi:tetrahydromethanopterin S-methyltransferase subunit A